MRKLMSASISLSLVNVPVSLYTAQKEDDLTFNQINSRTGNRIQQRKVDAGTGQQVLDEDIVKGYEVSKGKYVHITTEEIEALRPAKSNVIEIDSFPPLSAIDPIHYDRTYYALPDKGGAKPYALLTAALMKAKRVAIGKMTMRQKQHVVAIRATEGMLVVTTLFMPEEIMEITAGNEPPDVKSVDKKELDMALMLIGTKTAEDWEPSQYKDEYRENVLKLIESKAKGEAVPSVTAAAAAPVTTDLAAALSASLARAKKKVPA